MAVRLQCVEYMREHPHDFMDAVSDRGPFEDYLGDMSKTGTGPSCWGGHPEIRAYVELYRCVVLIYDGKNNSLPLLHEQRPDNYKEDVHYFRLELVYTGNHYETKDDFVKQMKRIKKTNDEDSEDDDPFAVKSQDKKIEDLKVKLDQLSQQINKGIPVGKKGTVAENMRNLGLYTCGIVDLGLESEKLYGEIRYDSYLWEYNEIVPEIDSQILNLESMSRDDWMEEFDERKPRRFGLKGFCRKFCGKNWNRVWNRIRFVKNTISQRGELIETERLATQELLDEGLYEDIPQRLHEIYKLKNIQDMNSLIGNVENYKSYIINHFNLVKKEVEPREPQGILFDQDFCQDFEDSVCQYMERKLKNQPRELISKYLGSFSRSFPKRMRMMIRRFEEDLDTPVEFREPTLFPSRKRRKMNNDDEDSDESESF